MCAPCRYWRRFVTSNNNVWEKIKLANPYNGLSRGCKPCNFDCRHSKIRQKTPYKCGCNWVRSRLSSNCILLPMGCPKVPLKKISDGHLATATATRHVSIGVDPTLSWSICRRICVITGIQSRWSCKGPRTSFPLSTWSWMNCYWKKRIFFWRLRKVWVKTWGK